MNRRKEIINEYKDTLEILEELEQKPGQSQTEFLDDLKTLEELWRANFDASKEYR